MPIHTPSSHPSENLELTPRSPADPSRLRARFLPENLSGVARVQDTVQRDIDGVMRKAGQLAHFDRRHLMAEDRLMALRHLEKSSDGVSAVAGFIRKASAPNISGIIDEDFLRRYYELELKKNPGMDMQERMVRDVNSPAFQEYLWWAMNTFNEIFTPGYWKQFYRTYGGQGAYPRDQVDFAQHEFFGRQASKIILEDRPSPSGARCDEYYWENITRILRTFEVELENRERALIQ